MEYSKLLSYLLKITGLRLNDIADLLHYDKSYISKWINGNSIPSASSIADIHSSLADLFSDLLFLSDNLNSLNDILPNDFDLSTQSMLNKYLYNLLNAKYFSMYHKINSNPLSSDEDNIVIIGRQKIIEFLLSVFSSDIDAEKIEIYSTISSNLLFDIINSCGQLWLFNLKIPIEFNMLFNREIKQEDFDDPLNFLKLLSRLSFYDINIFTKRKNQSLASYIYVKDKFIIFFQEFEGSEALLITFSKNPELIKRFNSKNIRIFKSAIPLLKTLDRFTYERYYYEKNLYTNKTRVLTSYIDGCFLPNSDIDRVLSKNKIDSNKSQILKDTLLLQKNSFAKRKYDIVINLVSLFSSLENNMLSMGPFYLSSDGKNFNKYLISSFKELYKNKNHNYYIIDSQNLNHFNWDYFMSFILNEKCFIAKKLDPFDKNSFKYLISTNPNLNKIFEDIYKNILSTDYIRKIELSDLKNLVKSKIDSLKILEK